MATVAAALAGCWRQAIGRGMQLGAHYHLQPANVLCAQAANYCQRFATRCCGSLHVTILGTVACTGTAIAPPATMSCRWGRPSRKDGRRRPLASLLCVFCPGFALDFGPERCSHHGHVS